MNFLIDTNVLLAFIRDEAQRQRIDVLYDPFSEENNPLISVVSIGEIKSIAKRNYWGTRRKKLLDEIIQTLIIIDINSEDIIEMYSEIDAYSQGKLKEKPLQMSSRNMGKNDLWIAATCCVTNATLLTTDKDFEHLNGTYIKLELV